MKILYVTTIGLTMGFFKELIRELLDEGHTVDIACSESDIMVPDCYRDWGCRVYQISCSRAPFDRGNLKAVEEIKNIVKQGSYNIVHCHTPIAGACTRLACRKLRKNSVRVFYTAHGFHFYKGASLINWFVFFPIEMICAYFTDVLITINKEDYVLAQKVLRAKRIEYVPGVGVSEKKFENVIVDRNMKRQELGIPDNVFLLLSAGELNKNKNHQAVIRAIKEINTLDVHYAIAGTGELDEYLRELAVSLEISDKIHFLGYRKDIEELYNIADIYVLPSIREGLNVSIMEAMLSGLPIICSDIRGNRDLVCEQKIGKRCDMSNSSEVAKIVEEMLLDKNNVLYSNERIHNAKMLYSKNIINRQMRTIYEKDSGEK